MKAKLQVLEREINTHIKDGVEYISITDIARYKNPDRTDDLIRNWLRNRNTIEFLGIWEQLNNPDFKPVEFDGFKKQAGLNSFVYASEADLLNVALFGVTARQWRDANPGLKGNLRDHADVHQLVCPANLESMNAHFISEGLPQVRVPAEIERTGYSANARNGRSDSAATAR
ncbi:KilA-N domain-containing protein [Ectopseudomonas guguanensis]|jgi:hypothetical protein|uniref:KilA-N domain-containing protein n=1 Tax=Ectopseudomonas guguanensis TaxID=1198456 RepID=UPI0039C1248C